MKASHDLSGLIRFAETDATWRPRLAKVVDEHLLPALEEFEIDFEDLAELLGEQLPWTLWGCAFEDFISRRYGKHGLSVVDAYLARGKGRDGAAAREYMLGLRDAWASLYEVSEVIPGQSMKLRDLIAGTAPVTVTEHSATQSLNTWDRIAARVVPVGDHHVISGGLLIYPAAASELLFDGLRQVLKLKRGEDPKLVPEKLQGCAPLISNAWLFSQLPGLLESALPALASARALTDRFTMRNGREDVLAGWLDEAEDSMIASFARGLRRDCAAVAAALREPWSNGQTEGQIIRLKTLKRQMYGRANIDLLRARLIVPA